MRDREKLDSNVRLGMKDLDMVAEVYVDIKIMNSCRLLFRSEAHKRIRTSGRRFLLALLFPQKQQPILHSHSGLQPSSFISRIISLKLIHLYLHAAIPAEKPYLTNTGQVPRCCMLMLHPECNFQFAQFNTQTPRRHYMLRILNDHIPSTAPTLPRKISLNILK